MAWSSASVVVNSGFNNDKPLFLVNKLNKYTIGQWTDDALNIIDNPFYSPNLAVNNYPAFVSKAENLGFTAYVQLEYYFATGIDFDVVGFLHHNFMTFSNPRVQIVIADNASFTSNLAIIFDSNPLLTSKRRISFLSTRYINVQYIALRITSTELVTPGKNPFVGLFFVSDRFQMAMQPNEPYDPDKLITQRQEYNSESGTTFMYKNATGLLQAEIEWYLGTDTNLVDVNQLISLNNLYDATDGFNQCFGWVPNPLSAPDRYFWVLETTKEFHKPYADGGILIEYSMDLLEQAPSFRSDKINLT
ncbi:MAG: hypothetical protein HC877_20730 [Thioploca sp.]|nr:hypothetical protein [Thioploca sp.]